MSGDLLQNDLHHMLALFNGGVWPRLEELSIELDARERRAHIMRQHRQEAIVCLVGACQIFVQNNELLIFRCQFAIFRFPGLSSDAHGETRQLCAWKELHIPPEWR